MSFRELTARSVKVKTSVGHEPRRCKEKKIHVSQVGRGVPKRTSMLDSGKKFAISVSSFFFFFSLGYVAYNCLVDAVVSCLDTLFLPAATCYLVVN